MIAIGFWAKRVTTQVSWPRANSLFLLRPKPRLCVWHAKSVELGGAGGIGSIDVGGAGCIPASTVSTTLGAASANRMTNVVMASSGPARSIGLTPATGAEGSATAVEAQARNAF